MDENVSTVEETQELDESTIDELFSEFDGPAEETQEPDTEDEADEITEEETTEETAEAEEPAEETQEPPKFQVDDKEYTADRIRELEKAIAEREELSKQFEETQKRYAPLEEMAKQHDLPPDTFLQQMINDIRESNINSRISQLVEQGIDGDFAKHVAELEFDNKNDAVRLKTFTQRQQAEDMSRQRAQEDFDKFRTMYPDVTEVPDEVYETVKKTGATLIEAYQHELLKQKTLEVKQQQKKEENKTKTPGSVKSKAVEGVEDEFLKYFTGG